ncbi:hypothetical protein [Solibacillus sp. FSL W7-1324]|uniref:hypothetical protein n=1 Tax=Solibacillus sp. FSL W7-1324 TaxID=2921701 RepID=UPI0030F96DC5
MPTWGCVILLEEIWRLLEDLWVILERLRVLLEDWAQLAGFDGVSLRIAVEKWSRELLLEELLLY